MASTYELQILTPQGPAYAGEVVHTLVPAENGFVGILANHAPFVTTSTGGRMVVREKNGMEKTFWLGAGFFEIEKNKASFLAESCKT